MSVKKKILSSILASVLAWSPTPFLGPDTTPIRTLQSTTQITDLDAGGDASPCDPGPTYDPLDCWLYKLEIDIPDTAIPLPVGTMTLSALKCLHFSIDDITSDYAGPGSNAIDAGVENIIATCKGHYSYGFSAAPLHGDFTASVGDASTVGIELTFTPDADNYMAESAAISKCDTHLVIPKSTLVFTGSVSAVIVELFAGPIASYMSTTISGAICEPLTTAADEALTKALQTADTALAAIVANGPSPNPPLPDPDTLVNWDHAPKVKSLLHHLNTFLNKHLSAATASPCGGGGGLDGLIDKFFPNGRVHVTPPTPLNVTVPIPSYGDLAIALQYLNVSGIDTFTNLTLLDPTGPYSLTTSVGMDTFNATVGIELTVTPIDGGMIVGTPLVEEFTLSLSLTDINILLKLLLAVDKTAMTDLSVYQLLSTAIDSTMPCAATTLVAANVTSLAANLKLKAVRLQTPPGTDPAALESEIDHLVDDLLLLFVSDYNRLVTDAVYGLLQGPVRDMANDALGGLLEEAETLTCNDTPGGNVSDYVHFDESDVVAKIDEIVNEVVGVEGVNDVLECLGEVVAASGVLAGTLFSIDVQGVHVDIKNLVVGDIGNFYDLQVLVPEIDHYKMRSDAGFGVCNDSGDTHDPECHPIYLGVTIDVLYEEAGIQDSLNVSVAMGDLFMSLGASLMFDKNRFGALKVPQLGDTQCVMSAFQEVSLYASQANLGAFEAQIHARLHSDGEVTTLNRVFNQTHLLEALLQEGLVVAQNAFNHYSTDLLFGAPYLCAGDPIPTPDGPGSSPTPLWTSGMAMIIYAALVILALFVYAQKYRGRRGGLSKEGKEGVEEPLLMDDPTRGTSGTQEVESRPEFSFASIRELDWEDSLMWHDTIPGVVRFGVPVVLILTIVLFLMANLGVGASVGAKLVLAGGQVVNPPPLFSFSLGNSVHDMWQAGVYPLSIMIALFSGVWPYLKLLLMMFAWMAPVEMCSSEKRETLLMWLDALGKYSLVDAYVLVMMMVAFRFHIDLSEESVVVDILVTPEFGFYGFLLGTMTSLAMGHIVLAFHRHATADYVIPAGGASTNVMSHVFTSESGVKFKLTTTCKVLTVLTLFGSIVLLGVGVTVESFNFEFKGAAGLVLPEPETSYSLLSLGKQIPLSVEDPDDFGIRWIEVTYYIFALGMPFGCLFVMLCLFTIPLSTRAASRMFVLAEVANAWSAMEVFVISVVAALLEIEQFAGFIIGDKCDGINKVLEAFLDKPLGGDDVCFDVVATLGDESWYLFTGAALSTIVSYSMLQIGHIALEDRYERYAGLEEEEEEGGGKKNLVTRLYNVGCLRCILYDEVGAGRVRELSGEGGEKEKESWGEDGGEGEEEEEGGENGGIYASSMITGPRVNNPRRK